MFASAWAMWGKLRQVGRIPGKMEVLVQAVERIHILIGDGEVKHLGVFSDVHWVGGSGDGDGIMLDDPADQQLG